MSIRDGIFHRNSRGQDQTVVNLGLDSGLLAVVCPRSMEQVTKNTPVKGCHWSGLDVVKVIVNVTRVRLKRQPLRGFSWLFQRRLC